MLNLIKILKSIGRFLAAFLVGVAVTCVVLIALVFLMGLITEKHSNFFFFLSVLLSLILGFFSAKTTLKYLRNPPAWISLVGKVILKNRPTRSGVIKAVFIIGVILGVGVPLLYFSKPLTHLAGILISLGNPLPTSAAPDFHWPPPQASTKELIPIDRLLGSHPNPLTLGHLNQHMIGILQHIGHTEYSYFSVPNGYALVTRLEKINDDGSPKPEPERWEANLGSMREFSLERLVRTLYTANRGYYRIIVFIVSSEPLIEGRDKISEHKAMDWLRQGTDRLPKEIAQQALSADYACTALVYEFIQKNPKTKADFLDPGNIPAHTHLAASGFYKALGE